MGLISCINVPLHNNRIRQIRLKQRKQVLNAKNLGKENHIQWEDVGGHSGRIIRKLSQY